MKSAQMLAPACPIQNGYFRPALLLGITLEHSSIRYRNRLDEVKENVLFILRRIRRARLELL